MEEVEDPFNALIGEALRLDAEARHYIDVSSVTY